ncbi:MAG: integrase [Mesorhizobium sp.]|nr:MAG: integrase [Mesorhizobium sp.]
MSLRMPGPWQHKKTGVYYLRQRAPSDLKDIPLDGRVAIPVGGTIRTVKAGATVKVSLDTKDPAEAKRRHREADAALHEFWQRFRQGPQPLTSKQIQALAGILYARLVDMMDSEPGEEGIWKAVLRLNKGKEEGGELDQWFGPTVDELFAEQGVNTDLFSRTRVVRAASKAIQLAAETNLRKAGGDYSPDEARKRFPNWEAERGEAKPAPRAAGDLDLFVLLDHKFATQTLKEKTKSDYARDLAKFVKSSGHRNAQDVTNEDVRKWRDELIAEGLSPSKVNGKALAALSAVLTHAVREFGLSTNVASDIRDRRDGPAPGKKGYDMEEAKAILSATFNGSLKDISTPHKRALFWVPWICAYTGLRVTEITQLRGVDVRTDGGTPYFLVTPEAGSTKSGRAWMTAIHPHLVELGLLEMFKEVGDGPAFYVPYPHGTDLTKLTGKPRSQEAGVRVGNWITEELGIPAPGGKPNHAWRHLFTSLSRKHDMDKQHRDFMLGSGPEDAREGYGDFPPSALAREIRKVPCFEVKKATWRPSNEVVPAQAQRERRKGKPRSLRTAARRRRL